MLKQIVSSIKGFFRKSFRILLSSGYGFIEDDCYTKASTLTFYTLQSIVPLLAAVFAIARGFGFDDYLHELIIATFEEQKEIMGYAIDIAYSTLKYLRSGVVVGFGVLFLLWTNINLVGYIEIALNDIWRVKTVRTFFQKLKDFSLALIIFPTVFVVSSSLTVYIKTKLSNLHEIAFLEPFTRLSLEMFTFLPLVLTCFLFFLLYLLMPNAETKIGPRMIAGIIAGIAFQIWQVVYINFQLQIFSYNIVYGAFALLPLFLVWMQFSWLIALAGAEISAHIENDIFFEKKYDENSVKISKKEFALLIIYQILQSYYSGAQPITDIQISQSLQVPLNLVQDMLELLTREGILAPIKNKNGELCYYPLHDPSLHTIKDICDSVDRGCDLEILVKPSEIITKIATSLDNMNQAAGKADSNIHLNELIKSIQK